MSETGYRRVSGTTRCNNGFRGFRVNIRRLSIHRLRVRFMHFFKVLFKWRKSYERAVKSFKKGITGRVGLRSSNSSSSGSSSSCNNMICCYQSKSRLIAEEKRRPECRLKSLGRTNSFYTEAIADCLEFIKRNSLSVDDNHNEATPIVVALR